ncbi:putative calcium/calmodulin-dependent protein kinase type II delta chain, partial [Chytriomyces sp. MP71]
LSEFQAQVVMRAVMEALVSCHARYYVHRDVKPSNLLLFNRDLNSIKLADFGIAAEDNGYSCVGGIKGTKGYMAPEILKKRQYGRPADIFSAGILTSTLFNNKPP